MAVDTKSKRMSMLSAASPIAWQHLFEVDGSVDADDRSVLLHIYGGIPLVAATLYVICNLVDRNGTEQASLTDLDWAWFDSIDPATFIAPTDQGATESTDGTGSISVDLPNTTLTAGQDGTLVLSNGTAYGAYRLTTV
jgi:hypothetical protein